MSGDADEVGIDDEATDVSAEAGATAVGEQGGPPDATADAITSAASAAPASATRPDAVPIADSMNYLVKEVGLPEAYLKGLSPSDFQHLAAANKALSDGDVAAADQAVQQFSDAMKDTKSLIKQFLIRQHLGQINPVLFKAFYDPTFAADPSTAEKGSTRAWKYLVPAAKKLKQAGNFQEYAQIKGIQPSILRDERQRMLSNAPLMKLSVEELSVLKAYSAQIFGEFNNPLRSDIGTDRFTSDRLAMILTAISGLNKARFSSEQRAEMNPMVREGHEYNGPVYRLINKFPGYADLHQAGAIVSDLAFMSTAKSIDGAEFATKNSKPNGLEIIVGQGGTPMENISVYGANEAEVLFRPGTRFRIKDRAERKTPGWDWPELQSHADLYTAWRSLQDVRGLITLIVLKEEMPGPDLAARGGGPSDTVPATTAPTNAAAVPPPESTGVPSPASTTDAATAEATTPSASDATTVPPAVQEPVAEEAQQALASAQDQTAQATGVSPDTLAEDQSAQSFALEQPQPSPPPPPPPPPASAATPMPGGRHGIPPTPPPAAAPAPAATDEFGQLAKMSFTDVSQLEPGQGQTGGGTGGRPFAAASLTPPPEGETQ